MKSVLTTLLSGRDLNPEQAYGMMAAVVDARFETPLLAGVLAALQMKGVTGLELASFARALLERATPFERPAGPLVDTCGTGGDGARTVNVSTASALLLASLGTRVAKHGNRSVSSQCGSADVLEAVGVGIEASPSSSRRLLDETDFCYLHAPAFHAGIAHAGPARRSLGVRTAFNLLGPLVNPARPSHQLVGVFGPEALRPVADALARGGVERALVVHGAGTDEIATHAPTEGLVVDRGRVETMRIDPRDFGFELATLDDLRVEGRAEAVERFAELLAGRGRPAERLAVALNAGAVLWLTESAPTLASGVRTAFDATGTGAAAAVVSAQTAGEVSCA
jgi:anthranilate phosphoribosyltransferase